MFKYSAISQSWSEVVSALQPQDGSGMFYGSFLVGVVANRLYIFDAHVPPSGILHQCREEIVSKVSL